MKNKRLKRTKTTRKNKNNNSKFLDKSGNIDFTKASFPSYEENLKKITLKVGNLPQKPDDLQKGKWTKQAKKVLKERYLFKSKDADGIKQETPDEMCWRVSWRIASAETLWGKTKGEINNIAKDFYNMLVSRNFLPNSPTLMNAGTGNGMQYSGCYVLPIEDSIEGIFDGIKYQAIIHKSGGGTGFSFSRLRPRGSIVKTSSGVASGPVSFMKIYDAATNEVKQGGKRRGANMGILRVDHPDIKEFINCKKDGGITNFNISVAITDKFIEALKKGDDYELINPKTKQVAGTLNAEDIFCKIVKGAWETGDPGLIFIDRINKGKANPIPKLGPIESTNPCGEQPLYPYDACNLGSIFLTYFVKEENGKREVDWEKLKKTTRLAVRFLDNVIEVNPYPLDQIRKTVLSTRRIGLGVGGWADMLAKLNIAYDSEKALKLAQKVMSTIQNEALKQTEELARKRGAFSLWPLSVYKNTKKRRNSTITTIAPTGSISIIAGASSGIEPFFAIAFQHIVKDKSLNRELAFVNPIFKKIAKERGFWNEDVEKQVSEKGVIRGIKSIPEDVRRTFGTAQEIDYKWHVRMQAIFQKNTENAVSKTINLPNNATTEDIRNAYLFAWETGCNGITIFRDGSKDTQVLNLGTKKLKEKQEIKTQAWTRPIRVVGSTFKIKTPVGTAFITVNQDEKGDPVEVFINVGRAGSDVQAMAEALGRLISKSLKMGSNVSTRERALVIVDQLKGIGGRRSVGFGPNKILSLPDAVSFALSSYLGVRANGFDHAQNGESKDKQVLNGEAKKQEKQEKIVLSTTPKQEISVNPSPEKGEIFIAHGQEEIRAGDICPSCGIGAFVYQEGCSKCYACGHSEC